MARSSAIQVLPSLSSVVSKITTFIREPTWVAPAQAIEARKYPEEERKLYTTDPQAHLEYRKMLESGINEIFGVFIDRSVAQKMTADAMTASMRDKLQNKDLENLVIPTFPVGCRRFTPGVNYLETMATDVVDVVYGEIEKITEKGCLSANGQEYPVDVLVCATGFDTSYKPRFPVIGSGGKNLADVWADEPKSYLGVAAHDFPNYLMVIGPNSPIGNGPVLIGMGKRRIFTPKLVRILQ